MILNNQEIVLCFLFPLASHNLYLMWSGVGRGEPEDVISCWPSTWAIGGLSSPSVLKYVVYSLPSLHKCSNYVFLLQGHSLEIVMCYWYHLDIICNWTQLKYLSKLLRFWGWGKDLLVLGMLKTNLACEFPCLLLRAISLEWSASFFILSLSSMYRASLPTNKQMWLKYILELFI